MHARWSPLVLLVFASAASHANNCEAIRSQIDAKVRASGTSSFTLTVVEAGAVATGRVVGTCDLGSKKIVYAKAGPPAGAAEVKSPRSASSVVSTPGKSPLLTECRDGSVSLGGDCKK